LCKTIAKLVTQFGRLLHLIGPCVVPLELWVSLGPRVHLGRLLSHSREQVVLLPVLSDRWRVQQVRRCTRGRSEMEIGSRGVVRGAEGLGVGDPTQEPEKIGGQVVVESPVCDEVKTVLQRYGRVAQRGVDQYGLLDESEGALPGSVDVEVAGGDATRDVARRQHRVGATSDMAAHEELGSVVEAHHLSPLGLQRGSVNGQDLAQGPRELMVERGRRMSPGL